MSMFAWKKLSSCEVITQELKSRAAEATLGFFSESFSNSFQLNSSVLKLLDNGTDETVISDDEDTILGELDFLEDDREEQLGTQYHAQYHEDSVVEERTQGPSVVDEFEEEVIEDEVDTLVSDADESPQEAAPIAMVAVEDDPAQVNDSSLDAVEEEVVETDNEQKVSEGLESDTAPDVGVAQNKPNNEASNESSEEPPNADAAEDQEVNNGLESDAAPEFGVAQNEPNNNEASNESSEEPPNADAAEDQEVNNGLESTAPDVGSAQNEPNNEDASNESSEEPPNVNAAEDLEVNKGLETDTAPVVVIAHDEPEAEDYPAESAEDPPQTDEECDNEQQQERYDHAPVHAEGEDGPNESAEDSHHAEEEAAESDNEQHEEYDTGLEKIPSADSFVLQPKDSDDDAATVSLTEPDDERKNDSLDLETASLHDVPVRLGMDFNCHASFASVRSLDRERYEWKPEWTTNTSLLKKTLNGSVIKKGVCLQSPITHIAKDAHRHRNQVANRSVLMRRSVSHSGTSSPFAGSNEKPQQSRGVKPKFPHNSTRIVNSGVKEIRIVSIVEKEKQPGIGGSKQSFPSASSQNASSSNKQPSWMVKPGLKPAQTSGNHLPRDKDSIRVVG